jgi:hypothetical protein
MMHQSCTNHALIMISWLSPPQDYDVTIRSYMLELYNDQILDLLRDDHAKHKSKDRGAKEAKVIVNL